MDANVQEFTPLPPITPRYTKKKITDLIGGGALSIGETETGVGAGECRGVLNHFSILKTNHQRDKRTELIIE